MTRNDRDRGFTLVELLVAMSLAAIMLSMTVWGLRSLQMADEHAGTAQAVTGHLREVQQRAVSEGISYCVSFAGRDVYTTFRFSCVTAPVKVDGPRGVDGGRTHLDAPSFRQRDGSRTPSVVFRPNGSATPGTVLVRREANSKVYTVSVEGLTGRVSYK